MEGPAERLRLFDELVAGRSPMPHELDALLLPRDLNAFDRRVEAKTHEVAELLDEGRALVEAVERLVCRLYALPVQPHDVRREGLRRTTEAARRAAVHAVPATSTATAMAFVTRGPAAVDRRVAGPPAAGRADSLAGRAISTATTTAAAMSNPPGGENASTPT